MCEIVGFLTPSQMGNDAGIALLNDMQSTIGHRGPDDFGM